MMTFKMLATGKSSRASISMAQATYGKKSTEVGLPESHSCHAHSTHRLANGQVSARLDFTETHFLIKDDNNATLNMTPPEAPDSFRSTTTCEHPTIILQDRATVARLQHVAVGSTATAPGKESIRGFSVRLCHRNQCIPKCSCYLRVLRQRSCIKTEDGQATGLLHFGSSH